MKKNALARPHSIIEALEGRIAPAVLVAGGNLLGGIGNPASGEFSIGENSFAYVKVLSGQAVVWFDGIIRGISVGPNASLEIAGDVFGDIVANLDANGRLTDSDSDPTNGLDGKVLLPNAIKGMRSRIWANPAASHFPSESTRTPLSRASKRASPCQKPTRKWQRVRVWHRVPSVKGWNCKSSPGAATLRMRYSQTPPDLRAAAWMGLRFSKPR